MYLLGVNLPDGKLAKMALRTFYGVGPNISDRLCARLQIHDRCLVSELTDAQVTGLSAFLSAPTTTPPPFFQPRANFSWRPIPLSEPAPPLIRTKHEDHLGQIKVETELRRKIREDIAHHREIGTHRGRRHALHLPVRGQRTNSNAKTAKKLNRVERRAYSTWTGTSPDTKAFSVFSPLRHVFWSRRPT